MGATAGRVQERVVRAKTTRCQKLTARHFYGAAMVITEIRQQPICKQRWTSIYLPGKAQHELMLQLNDTMLNFERVQILWVHLIVQTSLN